MNGRPYLQILTGFVLIASAVFGQNNRSAVSLTGNDAASCTVPDPCRTFGVAISKTNSGGEVVVLSTAGYGAFTVTQPVSIICPPAYHAAMAPTSGTAITVNASGATVVLRNLYLNSLGGGTGVSITSDTVVHIEGLVVSGFGGNGIEVVSTTGTAEVFVKDSEIRSNGASGIVATLGGGDAIINIDHVRLQRNNWGLVADSGVSLSVRDTVAARNLDQNFWFRNGGALATLRATVERSTAGDNITYFGGGGFVAENGARVTIRDSAAVRVAVGFYAHASTAGVTSEMALDRCLAAENGNGILAGSTGSGNGFITVSNSTAHRNTGNGIVAGSNGTIRAFGNTVTANGYGINGQVGTFRSGGHNFVDGNATDTLGTITSVPTM